MNNLLFISSYPFPLYKGSNQHAYFFIKSLASLFNVYAIFFIQPENQDGFTDTIDIEDLGIKGYDLCYFSKDTTSRLSAIISKNRFYRKIKRRLEFPYYYMNRATHPKGDRLVQDYICKYSIDIVHIEHFHYTRYLFYVPSTVKKVVVYHDLYHRIHWEQFKIDQTVIAKFDSLLNYGKKYLFEKYLALHTDLNIFLNPDEKKAFSKKSVCIPHIVNPEIRYRDKRKKDDGANILFLGGYNHPPNRVSLRFIIDSILPRLGSILPDWKLWVIGSGAEKYETLLQSSPYQDSIVLKGYVPDINSVFQDMDLALYPILSGGGIKTKVIETMAAGIPVITSPHGIHGLQGVPDDCIDVCRFPEDYLAAVERLVRDKTLREKKSDTGKAYIDQYHTFASLTQKIKQAYAPLVRSVS